MSRLKDFIDEFQKDILNLHGLDLLDPVEQFIGLDDEGRYSIYAIIKTKSGERTVNVIDTQFLFDEDMTDGDNFWSMADAMMADIS